MKYEVTPTPAPEYEPSTEADDKTRRELGNRAANSYTRPLSAPIIRIPDTIKPALRNPKRQTLETVSIDHLRKSDMEMNDDIVSLLLWRDRVGHLAPATSQPDDK